MSSSPSHGSYIQSLFDEFRAMNSAAVFENDVMVTIIPLLCGAADIPNQQDVLFTTLDPIVPTVTRPKPDFFDGARLKDLGEHLRNDHTLRSKIIPTKHLSVPVAPNFFLEVKGPSGSSKVALRQVIHDGAYGARGMHALQNYGSHEPVYDNKAYTFSATFHKGELKLHAHFMTAPTELGGRPTYHTYFIDGWQMTADVDTFLRGITAFRNIRDLAKSYRDNFIRIANTRAPQATANLPSID
ncbi:hypothetical protein LIA77_03256 [Sarocladium implicatum]|nr:hypothetical protein LIA77_03256 [Sarocladium implicatum]